MRTLTDGNVAQFDDIPILSVISIAMAVRAVRYEPVSRELTGQIHESGPFLLIAERSNPVFAGLFDENSRVTLTGIFCPDGGKCFDVTRKINRSFGARRFNLVCAESVHGPGRCGAILPQIFDAIGGEASGA